MIKILVLITALFFTGCLNKRGVSMQYYSDCKEYYDLQGFYHKDCNDELVTYKDAYKQIKETGANIIDAYVGKKEDQEVAPKNVW